MEILNAFGSCFIILVIVEIAFSIVCNIIKVFRCSISPTFLKFRGNN